MNSASDSTELELAEPHLREVLSTVGLDVEYVRSEGNTLYRLDADGREIAVLDYAGGYGSLMFGHNHPALTARAKQLLDEGTPTHAQFSRHPYANRVATELNRIVHRELGDDEPYFAIFANSGAEAIEAAVKHAELDRGARAAALVDEIETHAAAVRETAASGTAVIAGGALARLGLDDSADGAHDVERLLAGIARHNAEQRSRPPLFLTLEGSFHGKLVGSVQLTHNAGYRTPFSSLAAQARFVPLDRPEELRKTVENERGTLLDPVIADGVVDVVEREYPVFCAFLVEPIQGEGGINVLSEAFAREIQEVCAAIDCPVVIDEIQCGMGRTGTFLASSAIGLKGDYYALAKSLGGGIAKSAVMLVREARYRREFELVHSSTFAKDSFSCHIALQVLGMLEAEDGRAYRIAAERGRALAGALTSVLGAFPTVLREVRGKGLMLGLDFADQADSPSPVLRELSAAGFLGYAIAGYLLREHRIRTFPTASAVNTLRFEPSLLLTDEEIGRLETALRDVCAVLREQDGNRLLPSAA
ncbi:aminotransferase class III-fold pyridoxal phosphate-dependent enzyme [Streptomyces sp. CC208A]|uniref:aspartate aminotransferase family protein n=1 Tax=Streptomyces sp. CC208A TaxID=3044573 RepID=UPI0024A821BD|nr:aminotransferase class III-fold pyridoxal phosphate-dependent enzyme [Streptomyces sp. CC208A]